MKHLTLLFCFFWSISIGFSQNDTIQTDTTDLEMLKNLKVSEKASALQEQINQKTGVSSRKPLSQRESPSILSVISSEEIQKSGARDLIDVLRLVQGYDVGFSIDQTMALGVRGNFIDGGRVAIYLDGIDLNEILYQFFPLGNHVAVDNIDHIEIIRGPGSAVYGGTAALGVINIITKNQAGLNVYLTTGATANTLSRTNLTLNWAGKKQDFSYSVGLFAGRTVRSDQTQISDWLVEDTQAGDGSYMIYKDTFDLAQRNNSGVETYQMNVGLAYKNTSVRIFADRYQMQTPQYELNFQNIALEAKQKMQFGKKWNLVGKLNYYNQIPWEYAQNKPNNPVPFLASIRAQRTIGNLTASWDADKRLNFIFGTEYWYDHAQDLRGELRYKGKNETHYHNYALYAQSIWRARWFNVTAGLRFDHNNAFGSALVPRLGFTKKIEDFHFKLLYSNAFRAPSIENINLGGGNIRPERTEVFELELGYQFTPDMILAGNIFYLNTKNPIIYYYDATSGNTEGSYINFGETGSQGIELEYKIRQKWGYLNLNYSFYQRLESSKVERYQLASQPELFIQFPAHKISLNTNINLTKSLNLNISGNYFSKRYGYTHIDADSQEWQVGSFDPYILANIFLNYQYKKVGVQVGVNDAFNSRPTFFQAYKGDYSPLPTLSREFLLKLSFGLGK